MLRPFLLAGIGLAGILPAQRPSLWSTTSVPPGASAPSSVGTTVYFTAPGFVFLYSAITRQWTAQPVTGTPTVFQGSDHCIVRDGNLIHAFAAHSGAVQTLTTSGAATVVNGPPPTSCVTLVTEGFQAWAFGAFHGRWETTTLQNTNPLTISNRLIGMLRDGGVVYAVSAHHGTFVQLVADPFAGLSVIGDGEVGSANSPNLFRVFSAQQNNWIFQAVPSATGSYQRSEFAMMWAGNQIWAVSGLTGTLATYTATNAIGNMRGSDGVAAFVDGSNVVLYGAGRGQFVVRPSSSPVMTFDYHYALLTEGTQVTPFSAISCTLGPPVTGSFTLTTNDEVAYADGGAGAGYAYSPLLNSWFAPPVPATTVSLVRSAVVVGAGSAFWGLSARYGTWQVKVLAAPGTFQAPANAASFVAIEAGSAAAHVFDARLNRWASVTGAAPLTLGLAGHTVMAHDNATAYGFGPSGEWYAQPLTGAPTRFDTASSLGTVGHGGSLSMCSALGSFSHTGRFPELTQGTNLGNTLRMHQVAPPNSLLLFVAGFAPTYYDARPAVDGVLFVDPTSIGVTMLWGQFVDADGILDMDLALPNNPAFAGMQLHLQNLVLPPTGQPWLSSSLSAFVF